MAHEARNWARSPPVDAAVSVRTGFGAADAWPAILRGVPHHVLYRTILTAYRTNARGQKVLPTLRGARFMSRGALDRTSAVWRNLPWLPEAYFAEIVP